MDSYARLAKVEGIKKDLTNDHDEYSTISSRLKELISDFKDFAPKDNVNVTSLLDNFKESADDGNMTEAKGSVDKEIAAIKEDIRIEEEMKRKAIEDAKKAITEGVQNVVNTIGNIGR